ncbi:MAG: aspartate kinase [Firmicutes bacterium]|nr:aspartate kinase [Bacillota bacterium]
MKVLKFGGTSMANADSIRQVGTIIKSDPASRFVVVSAPGKREKADTKVTDLLYACFEKKQKTGACDDALAVVEKRFADIVSDLKIKLDLRGEFDAIRNAINSGASRDYAGSRGEYLSALVCAAFLGLEFIDAALIIKFSSSGKFEAELTNETAAKRLAASKGAVIPGFYGAMPDGSIKTFSRGGSDVTGSIIARAAGVSVYENWTDVDGFMTCDPRIVPDAALIDMLTYKELRELSHMGANILHSDSIFPVRKSDIPIHIRNTFNPGAKGTLIVPTKKYLAGAFFRNTRTVTGIAGRKDFIAIHMEKSMMNSEVGFARKVLSVLEEHNVSIEHMPSGIDTLSVIVDGTAVSDETLASTVSHMGTVCEPDNIEVVRDIALVAVVGHGMNRKKGTAAKVFSALYRAGVNIRMIDQGSSELNIIVGVENKDYETAIKALYEELKEM